MHKMFIASDARRQATYSDQCVKHPIHLAEQTLTMKCMVLSINYTTKSILIKLEVEEFTLIPESKDSNHMRFLNC